MSCAAVIVLCGLWGGTWGLDPNFPPGFMFGAATAAYQVEGGWNASDKSESIWDRFLHARPNATADGNNGDVACNSYYQWRDDVRSAAQMGLKMYRFSLSWPRILPSGFSNYISKDGTKYYSDLIDQLLYNGIEPMVTIYHWDLPQSLQDLGGWTNPLIVDWFADYARVVYTLYADRVKLWLTINEPIVVCDLSYNTGDLAPGIISSEIGTYLCNKNVMMAHAVAWRIYDEEFKQKYNGQVSIPNNLIWFEPATSSPEDVKLTELAIEYCTGRYSHPIYSKDGGWPPSIEKLIEKNSAEQGYPRSRLPTFTEEEKNLIKGTYDFYAINYYTTRLVRKARPGEKIGTWFLEGSDELSIILEIGSQWQASGSGMLPIYPEGLRLQINWLRNRYDPNMAYIITENGYSDTSLGVNDDARIQFLRDHLEQVLLSIQEDGNNIMGIAAWALIDDFEWFDGFRIKFGLYEVDFKDPKRKRIAKKSSRYYASIITNNSLAVPLQPLDWRASGYTGAKKYPKDVYFRNPNY